MAKVLDAPNLCHCQFTNLIDWSMGGTIAVALERTVYLYDYDTRNASTLNFEMSNQLDPLYCIQFNNVYYDRLALGSNSKEFIVADAHTGKTIYNPPEPYASLRCYIGWAFVLEWNKCNPLLLSSNYPNGSITTFDIRMKEKCQEFYVDGSELARIRYSPFDENLILVSDITNNISTIDLRSNTITNMDTTQMDTKSLEWSPYERGVFFCGRKPNTMVVHDIKTNTEEVPGLAIDTGSRVTSILFSKTTKEFVCGTNSEENHSTIKRYDYNKLELNSEEPVKEKCWVTNMCSNPQGTLQAFATSVETIEVWEMFESRVPKRKSVLKRQHGKFNPIEIR